MVGSWTQPLIWQSSLDCVRTFVAKSSGEIVSRSWNVLVVVKPKIQKDLQMKLQKLIIKEN